MSLIPFLLESEEPLFFENGEGFNFETSGGITPMATSSSNLFFFFFNRKP